MIINISIVCLVCLTVSCSSSPGKIALVKSPDGKGIASLVREEVRGMPSPPPEPTRIIASRSKLTVLRDGKIIYNSGFEKTGGSQGGEPIYDIYDLSWSADSSFLAYRLLNNIRVIAKNGKVSSFDIVADNALVSSFKWIDSKELLIISKGVSDPLDMHGSYVYYHGYLTESTYVKVSKVNVDTGKVEQRFMQKVKNPTFIFHSIGFENHEISPYSSRVAFSDGSNINIYDDTRDKVIAKAPIEGSVEGIWWVDKDTLIIGLGLLSGQKKFLVFDVTTGKIANKTNILIPLWGDSSYRNDDWFRKAF